MTLLSAEIIVYGATALVIIWIFICAGRWKANFTKANGNRQLERKSNFYRRVTISLLLLLPICLIAIFWVSITSMILNLKSFFGFAVLSGAILAALKSIFKEKWVTLFQTEKYSTTLIVSILLLSGFVVTLLTALYMLYKYFHHHPSP